MRQKIFQDKVPPRGAMDRKALNNLCGKIVVCSKGHKNGPTADFCWQCGEALQRPDIILKAVVKAERISTPTESIMRDVEESKQGLDLGDLSPNFLPSPSPSPEIQASAPDSGLSPGCEGPMQSFSPDEETMREIRLEKKALLFCHNFDEEKTLSYCLNNCVSHSCQDFDLICEMQKGVKIQAEQEKQELNARVEAQIKEAADAELRKALRMS